MEISSKELIEFLNLQPLRPEGGYYAVTYQSAQTVNPEDLPPRYTSPRSLGSAIFYFFDNDPDSFSAFHMLKSDEIYHFYLGDPVELYILYPGGSHEAIILGQDILNGQQVQYIVPHGTWQGSRLVQGGHYALMGTTMSPGFDYEDFILGKRDLLCGQYPDAIRIISTLTRD